MAAATTTFEITDYLEIQRLMHHFNLHFDSGDADGFTGLFVEDGVLEAGSGDCATPDERREKVIDSLTRPPHRHFTTNVVVEPLPDDPTRARAISCWIYMELPEGTPKTKSIGTYTDEFVKRDGRWYFQRRRARAEQLPG